MTADNVIDGEFDTQGWNRFSYVKGNPIRYKDPTGHEIVEPDSKNKETSWNIRKGDTLSDIAKRINKDYNMDVTVDDLLKANMKNKAVKNKDCISEGGKLNLSFLKIEKSYTYVAKETAISAKLGPGGGVVWGDVSIKEKKEVVNKNSGRKIKSETIRKYEFSGGEFGIGAEISGSAISVGIGKFNNMDDAFETFYGASGSASYSYGGVAISSKSKESGGRWYAASFQGSISHPYIPSFGISIYDRSSANLVKEEKKSSVQNEGERLKNK